MQAAVYKSSKQADMYLFLQKEASWDVLDPAVAEKFGEPVHVLDLDLSDDRKLARTDTATVRQHIETIGFHLQMPPMAENWAHWDNLKAGIRAGRNTQTSS